MAEVTVYGTSTCPWCKKVKDFLTEKKVEFTDHDVSSDEKAQKEMIDKSGQMGVPVIVIKDKVIVGFDAEVIEKALG